MIKTDEIQEKEILKLLYSKVPNSLSYDLIVEYSPLSKEDTDKTLESLIAKGILVDDYRHTNRNEVIAPITKRRKSYYLKEVPLTYPLVEHIKIGDKLIPRLFDGDTTRAEDVNAIIEAVVDYTNNIDEQIERRVQEETSKIYKQMIGIFGIFGIFVSIFAIIVISTDKMLTFSPDTLNKSWWSLLGQSLAMYLPVGIVIGGLLAVVFRSGVRQK